MAKNDQVKAKEFWDWARNQLRQMAQTGNPRGFAHGIDRSKFVHRSPISNPNQGFSIQAGRNPTDLDVNRFIESLGGNPYAKKLAKGGKASAPKGQVDQAAMVRQMRERQQAANQPAKPSLIRRMVDSAQQKLDEANAYNEARYSQLVGGDVALRDRVLGGVGQLGEAQRLLNEEESEESFGRQKAALASAGLANSNVIPAFQARSDRDLALKQQILKEDLLKQAIGYDIGLTDNLHGVIERREDTGPDSAQLLSQVMNYSLAKQQMADSRRNQAQLSRIQREALAGSTQANIPSFPGPQGEVVPYFAGGYQLPQITNMGPLRPSAQYTPRRRLTPEERMRIKSEKAPRGVPINTPLPPRRLPSLNIPYGPPQGPVYA